MQDHIHIALGDSAVGCLRAASQSHGMPGTVIGIPDDLSHGPLGDAHERSDYVRHLFKQIGETRIGPAGVSASWRLIEKETRELKADADRVVIWAGDNVSETTFLHMACYWLRDATFNLMHVDVSDGPNQHYVALHSPAKLASQFKKLRSLSDAERVKHSSEYERLCAENGLLRQWMAGKVASVRSDTYDALILSSCTADWSIAGRVVGHAMSRCDQHNRMSDLFFSSRLMGLIENGQIEAQSAKGPLREYAVRLARL